MREILYVQAGNFANYIGTHFWNTQDYYLAQYGDMESELSCPHDFEVSFRQGSGNSSLSPRVLILDRKTNFRHLAQTEAVVDVDDEGRDAASTWGGSVKVYKRPLNPQRSPGGDTLGEGVRHWSDFNHVSYTPRSFHGVPADWERLEGDWSGGQALFSRYNEDNALMEGSVRLFLEECDSPQGMQIINDTADFGGFVDSFMMSFHDEFMKLPLLVIPLLSQSVSRIIPADYQGIKKVINDALYLRSLNELASLTIPIQSPNSLPSHIWTSSLSANPNSIFHTSAILSAHVETATLPLRLKNPRNDIASLSSHLNWRGAPSSTFGGLAGIFPLSSVSSFWHPLANFSSTHDTSNSRDRHRELARLDVTRGLSSSGMLAYEKWCRGGSHQQTNVSSIHAMAYPFPESYPPLFEEVKTFTRTAAPVIRETTAFSSISTGTRASELFDALAIKLRICMKRRLPTDVQMEYDDLRVLVDDMWSLRDSLNAGKEFEGGRDAFGEDE